MNSTVTKKLPPVYYPKNTAYYLFIIYHLFIVMIGELDKIWKEVLVA
jgi:hypothetical protein